MALILLSLFIQLTFNGKILSQVDSVKLLEVSHCVSFKKKAIKFLEKFLDENVTLNKEKAFKYYVKIAKYYNKTGENMVSLKYLFSYLAEVDININKITPETYLLIIDNLMEINQLSNAKYF